MHAGTMCARFCLPLMPLTVAFGNSLQLSEQRDVKQRGNERKRDRKEREANIDGATDRRELRGCTELNWVTDFSSLHLCFNSL